MRFPMASSQGVRAPLSLVRAPVRSASEPAEAPSDAALVAGIRAGDERCKARIYLKHVDYIAGMCARLLRSVEASEDVVQDTFVIAFSSLASLREPVAFRGWLASIAVSQVHRRLARERLRRFLGFDQTLGDAPLDELGREDLSAEARSDLAALDIVLQTLPVRQRLAWMLRYVEDEPIDAVAQACGCSRATVKRWIAAADQRVREFVRIQTDEASS
jgi:RNA polymerase sigma-70 factor (ECF subfamily)